MSPNYLAMPSPPCAHAPAGQVFLLVCNWLTGDVGVTMAPADAVGAADFLYVRDHSLGLCRLPDMIAWEKIDQFVHHVVAPLMGCVRGGGDGLTQTQEAEIAKRMIARAVATWRDEQEQWNEPARSLPVS